MMVHPFHGVTGTFKLRGSSGREPEVYPLYLYSQLPDKQFGICPIEKQTMAGIALINPVVSVNGNDTPVTPVTIWGYWRGFWAYIVDMLPPVISGPMGGNAILPNHAGVELKYNEMGREASVEPGLKL